MRDDEHRLIVQGLLSDARHELGRLRALLIVYRALLEDAGIEAPDDTQGAEALRRYRRLFEQHGHDDDEQHNELLANWWVVKPLALTSALQEGESSG